MLLEIHNDDNFMIKLSILSSFQRSGRQSEISSSANPLLYTKYEQQDVINMQSSVDLKYFKSINEIECWSKALIWDDNSIISKLIKAVHHLDLRRIPSFDETIIKNNVCQLLNIQPNCCIIKKLWEQSGWDLNISGDRDLVINKDHRCDRFYILSNSPNILYFELRKALL